MEKFFKYFIVLILCFNFAFALESKIDKDMKKEVKYIAALSSKYLNDLEKDQLQTMLSPYFEINPDIQAAQITDTKSNKLFLTYFIDKGEMVFNKEIPKELKSSKSVSQKIIYNGQVLGNAVIYYKKKINYSDLGLSEEEKKWINENPINRIAVMNYWPHDDKGESLHTEVLKLINKYSGLNLVPIKFDVWNEGYKEAVSGTDLCGIMGLSWSREREKVFFYSPAYNFTPAYLITKKTNMEINSFKDLGDKTVYLKTNSITHKMMLEKSSSTKIIDMDNINEIYEKLSLTNDADAMLTYFIDEEIVEEYGLKKVEAIYDRYGEVAIGINKNYEHLNNIITKVFDVIPKNELSAIREKDWGDKSIETLYALTKKEKKYLKEKGVVNICINPDWEPIEFSEEGTPKGISIDILNIIKEKLGVEYNFVKTSSWSESQKFLEEKKCDILPSAVKTQKREKYANFTQSYLNYDLAIITTSDKPLVKNLESISSKTMSRKQGSGLIPKLKEIYPYMDIKESKGYKESLEEVMNGDVYFTIATIPVFSYYKSKYGIKNLQVAGYTDMKYTLSIAVRNDDKTLLKILNKNLKSIPKSTYDVVHEKWANVKVVEQVNWKLIFQIAGVILVVVLFLVYNNRKLQKMVDKKTADLREQKNKLAQFNKNLEGLVEERTHDLELSKRSTEQILANILLPILITSKERRVVLYANRFSCDLYERSLEQLIGAQVDDVYTLENGPDEIIEQVEKHGKVDSYEIIVTSSAGKVFNALLSVTPINYRGEECYIGMTVDITHQKRMENEIREVHKHTKESIEYASLIQHSLIPDNNLFGKYFSDYLAIWHPKDIVGGDIYLFEELRDDNECLLMVIDCTGHGVPGAFVTMLVKAIERQVTASILNSRDEVSPAAILKVFNRTMKKLLKQEDENSISNAGFDGGILYYNKKDSIVKFAGAQTPLFYIDENREFKTIKGSRHSIGYKKSDADFEFKEHTINVKEQMQFYLTTDGYLDQNGGEKGFPLGKKRFKSIIENFKEESFAKQQEIFLNSLREYQKDEERNDDVTLVGFKIG